MLAPHLPLRGSPHRCLRHSARAFQFADDAQAILRSLDEAAVRAVLEHLETFGAASGQHINSSKSTLLPIGSRLPALPPSIAGIPVATTALVLGATITSSGRPRGDPDSWSDLIEAVKGVFTKLSKLKLSVAF